MGGGRSNFSKIICPTENNPERKNAHIILFAAISKLQRKEQWKTEKSQTHMQDSPTTDKYFKGKNTLVHKGLENS